MAKAPLYKKKNLFTSKLDLNLRKKPVKWYICSIALYGAETWTFRNVGQKYPVSGHIWCSRRMEKIRCTDRVKNKEVHRIKDKRNMIHAIKRRKANWAGHNLHGKCRLKKKKTLWQER